MPSRWEKFRRILDSCHEKHLAYLPFLWLSLAMLLVFVLPGSQEYALWRVGLGFMVITVYYYCYYYLLKGSELRALCYLLIQLILICTRLFHWRYGETKPSRSEHSCSHCCCWGTCEDTQPSQTLTVGNSGVAQPWGRAQQWGEASWWITALLFSEDSHCNGWNLPSTLPFMTFTQQEGKLWSSKISPLHHPAFFQPHSMPLRLCCQWKWVEYNGDLSVTCQITKMLTA